MTPGPPLQRCGCCPDGYSHSLFVSPFLPPYVLLYFSWDSQSPEGWLKCWFVAPRMQCQLVFVYWAALCAVVFLSCWSFSSLGVIVYSEDIRHFSRSERGLLPLPTLRTACGTASDGLRITSALCWCGRGTCHPCHAK